MPPSFLAAVNFNHSIDAEFRGLSAQTLSFLGNVYAEVTSSSIHQAFTFLQETFCQFQTSLDVTSLESVEDVISLLDAGAANIFVTKAQLALLREVDNVDSARLVLFQDDSASQESIQELCSSEHGSICFSGSVNVQSFAELLRIRPQRDGVVYIVLKTLDTQIAAQLKNIDIIPIVPAHLLTSNIIAEPELMPVTELFLAKAVSDRPDGLFPTLVTDERNTALGLVYSSKESVSESLRTGRGVYQSRKRGLWYKGESTGDVQELISISLDCDQDCLQFMVRQKGRGFCHLATASCFGPHRGLSRLQQTLMNRKESAPQGSYTNRLFKNPELLTAKIQEEARELCDATEKDHIAFEAADLLYFVMTKCVAGGVSLQDIERNLDVKSVKVKRRPGNAKGVGLNGNVTPNEAKISGDQSKQGKKFNNDNDLNQKDAVREAASVPKSKHDPAAFKNGRISMTRYIAAQCSAQDISEVLKRPSQRSTDTIMGIVKPIIDNVRRRGDAALLEYTHKFEKATSLTFPVLHAPFSPELMQLDFETINAIDVSFENIRRFHAAQKEERPLFVETMPGVVCSRFSRPIERVGLYVPGGTAVLPSTALMLGVPAMVAGCKKIVLASPPRADGSLTPEIVYVAHKVGAHSIVLAGGAQAVAALAYGTESVSKVDKILGPGNQFVTAGKMLVSNDTTAGVSIDMPAGPSEVLVIADATSNPAFVASDLLSQAEHGVDSQVILIAIDMDEKQLAAIEEELHVQALALPRIDIVRGAIAHSVTLVVSDVEEAMSLSNEYAPEHLILQNAELEKTVNLVENAGSVFIGPWTPESVGDYSAGVNHSLPTYGYARQYSGVNLGSYVKHITSSQLTQQGLRNVGGAVMQLAKVEELEAHRRAVSIRIAHMDQQML